MVDKLHSALRQRMFLHCSALTQPAFVSVNLTSVFSLFVNYHDTFYCMPSYKKNIPRGTTESWPRSCSIIIGNWLLQLRKETCQYVIVCVPPRQSKDTISHSFSWSSFYCWVKWQACFLYINNNHMKKHTRHGYMEVKAVCVCCIYVCVCDHNEYRM